MTPPDTGRAMGRGEDYLAGYSAALRSVLELIDRQAAGWRWRIGPSACADPVTVYVGHVWRANNPRRVVPVVGATLEECARRMVERIGNETAGHAVARAEPASDTG